MKEQENNKKEQQQEAENKDVKQQNAQPGTDQETDTQKSDEKPADDKKAEQPDPLEVAKQENAELKDRLLRTIAEFDNYKKRTLKEKADLILNGGLKTVTAILPVLDDMERAIANADKNGNDAQKLEEGWELIFKKFQKVLEQLGVKKIDTKDADFDTDYHEAVAMVPGMGDNKKGKVIDCVQTGYTMNDKVIRHAKVAVGQ